LQQPPYFHFFLVFGAVGGLCLWFSVLSSTPVAALIEAFPLVVSPAAIFVSSCFLYRRYRVSRFHTAAFIAGIAYLCLVSVLFVAGALSTS
jgi:hypothetical protein